MKKTLLIFLIACSSFISGYALNTYLSRTPETAGSYKKVTGIGGIFFKCKEPAKQREWYKSNLGFNINDYGAVFE